MHYKRFIPIGLVAAAGIAVAACSGGGSSTPAPVATNPPATTAAPTPDQQFLSDVTTGANKLNEPALAALVSADPSALEGVGHAFCSDMSNGSTVSAEVVASGEALVSSGLSTQDAGNDAAILILAGAKVYCPQYLSAVASYANS